jgi:2-haloacid dehalogenase
MKYKWILFDADDTLFDYDRAEARALRKAFDEFGVVFRQSYAQRYREINAEIWARFERGEIDQVRLRLERFALLFDAVDVQMEPASFSQSYLNYLSEGYYLLDGAEDLIRALDGKVKLALITNGLKDVQRPRLAGSTIGDYFDPVIISEEVGAAKPARKIFDVAFVKMAQPEKAEVLIVGDSLSSDMRGGSDYGIDTCWFNPNGRSHPPDINITYQIQHLDELLVLL